MNNLLLKNTYNSLSSTANMFSFYQTLTTAPQIHYIPLSNKSTDTKEIEQENRKHIDKLKFREDYFINTLINTDFEDGESNEAIEFINEALENSMPTSLWIAELFNKYSKGNDQLSITITYGLLRIIAYLDNKDCFNYIKSVLLLILESALNSDEIYIQEAALMVIESWRDEESFYLIKDYNFNNSRYLKNYSDVLKNELQEELGVN